MVEKKKEKLDSLLRLKDELIKKKRELKERNQKKEKENRELQRRIDMIEWRQNCFYPDYEKQLLN